MSELLQNALYNRQAKKEPAPNANTPAVGAPNNAGLILDSATIQGMTFDAAADFSDSAIKLVALHCVNEWASTNESDLEPGENMADRLLGLMVGVADENIDGELDDNEQAVVNVALNAAADYLLTLGVSEEDVNALLNDWDATAGDRVRDLVASNLPEGEEAEEDAIDAMVFTPADQAPIFDSAIMDAAYRKTVAVHGGKRVIINKRISGTVRLSAAKKVALRKARAKATSPAAMARRAKSMRARDRLGLNKRKK